MKRLMSIIMIGIIAFSLIACDTDKAIDDAVDKVADVVQSENKYVVAVKGSSPEEYPKITYEEAFEAFFGNPKWTYFKGTRKGPDEDGDGKEDYTEDDLDVVEFTGSCVYADAEVEALIQFELDMDAGMFEVAYLSFNDVPQSNYIMYALIEKVFASYSEEDDYTYEDEEDDYAYEDEEDDYAYKDKEVIYALDVAGKYSGVLGNSYAEIHMYTGATGDNIGKATVYIDSEVENYGGIEYSGQLYAYDTNVYMLDCDDENNYQLCVYEGASGIEFEFFINGSYAENYFMMEHFES